MRCSFKVGGFASQQKSTAGMQKTPLASAVARACMGTLLMAPTLSVFAQSSQAIDEIIVTGHGTKIDNSTITKLTEPLRDTPQSIQVLSKDYLDKRGVTSLEEALRTVPGITLGAGEFSWQGNNPNIRGFSSRNDMFLDGIRDYGSYARDPFNLEAVEVLQGPSSTVFGRGSTGGIVNQASKKPLEDSLTSFKVNVGTDNTLRGAVDLSRPVELLGDGAAFRINLMAQQSEVADRDGGELEHYGMAPSLALGLGTPTRLTLSYMKQVAHDTPDYGLPWNNNGRPAEVPRSNFYGFDSDYLDTDADIFTTELAHDYSPAVKLNAQFRYANYTREMRITEPLIAASVPIDTPLQEVTVNRYVFFGDSKETLLYGTGSATFLFNIGSLDHTLVTGVELARETSAPTFGFAVGVPGTNLLNPDQGSGFTAANMETRVISDTDANSLALYALDTIKFTESWQLVAGLRWDRFDFDYNATRFAGTPTRFMGAGTNSTEAFQQVNKEFSYRAALVYKPVEAGSIYMSLGSSFNPSAEGLSFLTTGRGLGLGNQNLDPEKNRSYELGTKWELFEKNVTVNGAVFRTTKTNARLPDPNNPGFNILAAELQVDGVSVEVTSNITDNLALMGGYTFLDGEGPCRPPCVLDTPDHSLSTWATYRVTERLQLGAGGRYLSERFAVTAPGEKRIPGYWAFDAMGSYQWSEQTLLKLNLTNLTNKEYFSQLHPWHLVPAPGFTAMFAINMQY